MIWFEWYFSILNARARDWDTTLRSMSVEGRCGANVMTNSNQLMRFLGGFTRYLRYKYALDGKLCWRIGDLCQGRAIERAALHRLNSSAISPVQQISIDFPSLGQSAECDTRLSLLLTCLVCRATHQMCDVLQARHFNYIDRRWNQALEMMWGLDSSDVNPKLWEFSMTASERNLCLYTYICGTQHNACVSWSYSGISTQNEAAMRIYANNGYIVIMHVINPYWA